MAITVYKPISEVSGITYQLVSGGDLEPNTTYYFIVIAYAHTYFSPVYGTERGDGFHSDISEEISFTTTTAERSVQINWVNPPEHTTDTRYQILITKTSGDYTNSGGYGVTSEQVGNLITDGSIGFLLTYESEEIYMIHSIQSTNTQTIPNHLGIICVDIDGGVYTNPLKNIIDAIINAGFGDYISYEYDYYLTIKGWIRTTGTGTGSGIFYGKTINFYKGGLKLFNPNFKMIFGLWLDDIKKADYTQGCSLDFVNSRSVLSADYQNTLSISGCKITYDKSRNKTINENKYIVYYFGTEGSQFIVRWIDGIKDSIIGTDFRGTLGDIKDLKIRYSNNWSDYNNYRLDIVKNATLSYRNMVRWYNCKLLDNSYFRHLKIYQPSNGNIYRTYFYNCYYPNYEDNIPEFAYSLIIPQSDSYTQHHYGLNIKVSDEDGNPLSGATISLKDKNNDDGIFIEYENTIDKDVTGNEYTGSVLTDVNGEINYYLKSYKVILNPENIEIGTLITNTIKIDYYPYKIVIEKDGYETHIITLLTILRETNISVVLKKQVPLMIDNTGKVHIKTNPKNIGNNREFLI